MTYKWLVRLVVACTVRIFVKKLRWSGESLTNFFKKMVSQQCSGVRQDVRAARVSSAAPKKKSFDRGGPVWPPWSDVTNDRFKGGHILLWRWVPLPFQTGRRDVAPWPKTWPELNWPDLTWFSRIFDLILMAFWLQKCNIFTLSWQRWCSNFHGFLNPNFDGFWIDFWIRSENIDFVKIVLPPAREHDF